MKDDVCYVATVTAISIMITSSKTLIFLYYICNNRFSVGLFMVHDTHVQSQKPDLATLNYSLLLAMPPIKERSYGSVMQNTSYGLFKT